MQALFWRHRGQNPVLSPPWALVWSLLKELRSYLSRFMAKKKKRVNAMEIRENNRGDKNFWRYQNAVMTGIGDFVLSLGAQLLIPLPSFGEIAYSMCCKQSFLYLLFWKPKGWTLTLQTLCEPQDHSLINQMCLPCSVESATVRTLEWTHSSFSVSTGNGGNFSGGLFLSEEEC